MLVAALSSAFTKSTSEDDVSSFAILIACFVVRSITQPADDAIPLRALWHAERIALLVVEAMRHKDGGTVVTVRATGSAETTLFETREPGRVVALFPTRAEGGHFLILWAGASAFTVEILGIRNGSVVTLLKEPADGMPEFMYLDWTEPVLILSERGWHVDGAARKLEFVRARIYRWRGTDYSQSQPVPWQKRFEATIAPTPH